MERDLTNTTPLLCLMASCMKLFMLIQVMLFPAVKQICRTIFFISFCFVFHHVEDIYFVFRHSSVSLGSWVEHLIYIISHCLISSVNFNLGVSF